jgi:hypothetical protein
MTTRDAGGAEPIGLHAIIRDEHALARAHDAELDRDVLFVPGKSGRFAIVDVADPGHPRLVRSEELGEDAETVLCSDGYVFVGARSFFSVDVRDRANPRVCARIEHQPRIDLINGMIAWDDRVLFANKRGWIGVVDVRNPEEPVFEGALDTEQHGGIVSPHDIARSRDCIVIVDQRDGSALKLRLYRVADPATGELLPIEKWRQAGAVAGDELNGANRVDIYGNYAVIGNNKANTVAVVDIGDPDAPRTVAVVPFPGEPCGLVVSGAVAFAAGGRAVQAFDLTDPENPTMLAAFESAEAFPSELAATDDGSVRYTYKNGERVPATGNAHDLVYREGYLYVTAQSDHQVAVLRIDDATIRRLAEQPPVRFGGRCVPVHVTDPVTMTRQRRVRPQSLVFGDDGRLEKLLYSTDGSGGVTIATGLAETDDGGATWTDHHANPVLDRIESTWQGRRAFGTALTRDEDNDRWVMATVGDDTSGATAGQRAVGLWFSRDLVTWTQHAGNPIITVETDGAPENRDILPGPDDPPVGMYLRHFLRMDRCWYALVQWRGDQTWSRMTVMQSDGDITGPWRFRSRCLDPETATSWFATNRNFNWSQPIQVAGRWYAVCQNGVAPSDRNNTRVGIVYSDDYLHWYELDNPVTDELVRPDGTPVVSSQQFLLPPESGQPWRILLGARGVHGGEKYMYLVYPR